MFRRSLFAALCLSPCVYAAPWEVVKIETLPAPAGISFTKTSVRSGSASAYFHAVTFSADTHTFALMDDPASAYDLASAAKKRGALAAVNGGYFQPDRTPLGLRVRQGQEIHPLEKSRLLSGLLCVNGGRISLLRVGEFKRTQSLREAVQAGPFLVDGGKPVAGLNATRSDPRTAIVARTGNRWSLVSTSVVTLAELGDILASPGAIGAGKATRALNLDGGSSTGLWVGTEPAFYTREFRDVRDFIGIVPR